MATTDKPAAGASVRAFLDACDSHAADDLATASVTVTAFSSLALISVLVVIGVYRKYKERVHLLIGILSLVMLTHHIVRAINYAYWVGWVSDFNGCHIIGWSNYFELCELLLFFFLIWYVFDAVDPENMFVIQRGNIAVVCCSTLLPIPVIPVAYEICKKDRMPTTYHLYFLYVFVGLLAIVVLCYIGLLIRVARVKRQLRMISVNQDASKMEIARLQSINNAQRTALVEIFAPLKFYPVLFAVVGFTNVYVIAMWERKSDSTTTNHICWIRRLLTSFEGLAFAAVYFSDRSSLRQLAPHNLWVHFQRRRRRKVRFGTTISRTSANYNEVVSLEEYGGDGYILAGDTASALNNRRPTVGAKPQ